jgi:hypothetical protein
MSRSIGNGWGPLSVLPRVAGAAVSIPVVAGFVMLGAAVVVVRSARELAREAWSYLPPWPAARGSESHSETHAA